MPFTDLTPLPTAPQRTDDSDTFITRADAFVAALATFVTEFNTFQTELEAAAALIAAAPAYSDPGLVALAGNTPAADRLPYYTGAGTSALATLTSVARTLLAQATQAAMRETGLGMSANGSSLVSAADYAAMRTLLAVAALASPNFTGTPLHNGLEIGYRDIPRVTGGLERGKCFATSAGFTVDSAAAGDTYMVYNDSASSITLTAGTATLRLHGTATTGNRTLLQRGMATLWFNTATDCVVLGDVT